MYLNPIEWLNIVGRRTGRYIRFRVVGKQYTFTGKEAIAPNR